MGPGRELTVGEQHRPGGASESVRKPFFLAILASAAFVAGCATFPPGGERELQEEIAEILSTPPLDQVNWGIRIVDPDRGQILYSRHAHLKFVPASNMKILSTATALSLLGPNHRYRTDLFSVGAMEEGGSVLTGRPPPQSHGRPNPFRALLPFSGGSLGLPGRGLVGGRDQDRYRRAGR